MNSLLSKAVSSMNQPTPLALWSMRIVPALGFPKESKPAIAASANCPAGRSLIWKLMSSCVSGWSKSDQILVALLLSSLDVGSRFELID